MVMLIAGGSLSTGSHDPYCGTLMPLGPSTPSVGLKHEARTKWIFISSLALDGKYDDRFLTLYDSFFRKLTQSDRLLVPEAGHYRHAEEGPDDMPAHIRAALTLTQVSVPIED